METIWCVEVCDFDNGTVNNMSPHPYHSTITMPR